MQKPFKAGARTLSMAKVPYPVSCLTLLLKKCQCDLSCASGFNARFRELQINVFLKGSQLASPGREILAALTGI